LCWRMRKPTPWQRGTQARQVVPPCRPPEAIIDNGEKEKMMQTLWLLGGMGLGAGLMYLLDPQQGEGRRDGSVIQVMLQPWLGCNGI